MSLKNGSNKTKNIRNNLGISRKIFYILMFILPVNLGYHFVFKTSYVNGLLVDYLIPTLYLQDLVVVALVFFWITEEGFTKIFKDFRDVFKQKENTFLVLFLVSVLFSCLATLNYPYSYSEFIRLVLYSAVYFYTYQNISIEKDFKAVVGMLMIGVVLISILGIAQFFKQSSVFDNYLFFGEQPYTFSTRGLSRENFFGVTKIPSYATFRHPNVFGGFLSLCLIMIYVYHIKYKGSINKVWISGVFISGAISLFYTLSLISAITFVLSVILIFLSNIKNVFNISNSFFDVTVIAKKRINIKALVFIVSVAVFLLGLSLPLLKNNAYLTDKASFYRRANLLSSSYELIKKNFVYGVGYGQSTRYIETYLPGSPDLRFAQPVHNIFVLIFTEAGFLSVLLFTVFLITLFFINQNDSLIRIIFLHILILGSFDHYLITMHQTLFLLFVLFGFTAVYKKGKLDKNLIV